MTEHTVTGKEQPPGAKEEILGFFGIDTEEGKQAAYLAIFSSIVVFVSAFIGYVAFSIIAPESQQFAVMGGISMTCFSAGGIGVLTVLTNKAARQIAVEIKLKKED